MQQNQDLEFREKLINEFNLNEKQQKELDSIISDGHKHYKTYESIYFTINEGHLFSIEITRNSLRKIVKTDQEYVDYLRKTIENKDSLDFIVDECKKDLAQWEPNLNKHMKQLKLYDFMYTIIKESK